MGLWTPENRLSGMLDSAGFHAIVPVTTRLPDELAATILADADAVELRVDELLPCTDELLRQEAFRYGRLPLIATVRTEIEGGKWIGSTSERLELFERMLPHVDGVDVELASAELADVIDLAGDTPVIVSAHHFDGDNPLNFRQFDMLLHRAQAAGADYFKIAAMTNDEDSLAHLLGFMELNQTEPIIAVAMGELGQEGRKRLLELGSRATFAYVGNTPVVPGQVSLADFVEFRDGHA